MGDSQHGDKQATRSLAVADAVEEIRLDLRRPRGIKVVGRDSRGKPVEYWLRVTRKGGLTLT